MGIKPEKPIRERKPSLKIAAFAVIATIRMKKMKDDWQVNLKVKEKLLATMEQTRKKARRKAGS